VRAMKVTLRRALLVCGLAGSLALALALAAGAGLAEAKSLVVGPGESIQKAVYAADPGDTIVVKGVHREDVAIRKDGIKLRGVDDAVIEPPARPDSPCSRTFEGAEAICVFGDVNLETGEITGRPVRGVSVSGFTIRGFEAKNEGGAILIDFINAANNTVAHNEFVDNSGEGEAIGITVGLDSTIAGNSIAGSQEGGINIQRSRDTTVANNDVKGDGNFGILVQDRSIDTTLASNDFVHNEASVVSIKGSTGTRILSNQMRRYEAVGIFVEGPRANAKPVNAKIVGNDISGGGWGILVTHAHGGSIAGNEVHDNCAGMFFEAFPSQPVGDFEVKGNTVDNNSQSCRAARFGRAFSGIGIALLGAREMEVTANHLSGNVPSGPTRVWGGVVVAVDPYVDGAPKPTNNTVVANNFGNNRPDIRWDGTGTGNVFSANNCDTSVPARLCD
jgi:parallel beta-helix repeat protein